MNQISAHITLEQAVHSDTAIADKIDNSTNDEHVIANMKNVAEKCYEKAVANFGADKISFASFFRSLLLNTKIGGASTSQHMHGEAIDVHGLAGLLNVVLFFWLKANVEFDQLILEKRTASGDAQWVHISNSMTYNRKQVLIAEVVNGKTVYLAYSDEAFKRIYPNHIDKIV